MNAGLNLVDPRGRLLPRSYDVLGVAFNLFSQKLRLNFLCYHFIHTFHPFGISILQAYILHLYFRSLIQMLLPLLPPHYYSMMVTLLMRQVFMILAKATLSASSCNAA